MFRIAICDDDGEFIFYLEKRITAVLGEYGEAEFFEYHSGRELLFDLYGRPEFDVLFLDVQMPEMDGNAVAREFREKYYSTMLVFCSGACLPTPETFKVRPYRYLMKQYSDSRFEEELKEVFEHLSKKKESPIVWGCYDKTRYKLGLDDILYISIAKRGCTLHLLENSALAGISHEMFNVNKLSELYEDIKDFGFAYAHNSYVVNMKYVRKRNATELELVNGCVLTISRSKGKEFDAAFSRYLSSKYLR